MTYLVASVGLLNLLHNPLCTDVNHGLQASSLYANFISRGSKPWSEASARGFLFISAVVTNILHNNEMLQRLT